MNSKPNKIALANKKMLEKIFTLPENEQSTLSIIEQEISRNLHNFLSDHIVASEDLVGKIEDRFGSSDIPETPRFVSDQADFLLKNVVSQSVHTYSPKFIGHMTSALPYFMLPLAKIMMALNQNVVKIETSKSFTPLERQTIAMLHRLIYQFDDVFYQKNIHKSDSALGIFCSGGTIANMTALWVARNQALKPQKDFAGVIQEGLPRALKYYGYDDVVVLVSERGHYSFSKTADLLGIGKKQICKIPIDANHRCDLVALEKSIQQFTKKNIKILAIVGIAGTTETGHIDPLDKIADLCREHQIHFHVDGAWGGPILFSKSHAELLKGIEHADSVTFDAHKQLYVPMGAGAVFFKNPEIARSIEQTANYIIRRGSRDLGKFSMEGSRPGMALLVHSALHIIGRQGYELLIDQSFAKAREFAKLIEKTEDFELTSEPQTNILTYRYVPKEIRSKILKAIAHHELDNLIELNKLINKITIQIQKSQRAKGKSFVSRTIIKPSRYPQPINVFRVVLANPLTTTKDLSEILEEQREIYQLER